MSGGHNRLSFSHWYYLCCCVKLLVLLLLEAHNASEQVGLLLPFCSDNSIIIAFKWLIYDQPPLFTFEYFCDSLHEKISNHQFYLAFLISLMFLQQRLEWTVLVIKCWIRGLNLLLQCVVEGLVLTLMTREAVNSPLNNKTAIPWS